jgi:hypothetical protein
VRRRNPQGPEPLDAVCPEPLGRCKESRPQRLREVRRRSNPFPSGGALCDGMLTFTFVRHPQNGVMSAYQLGFKERVKRPLAILRVHGPDASLAPVESAA